MAKVYREVGRISGAVINALLGLTAEEIKAKWDDWDTYRPWHTNEELFNLVELTAEKVNEFFNRPNTGVQRYDDETDTTIDELKSWYEDKVLISENENIAVVLEVDWDETAGNFDDSDIFIYELWGVEEWEKSGMELFGHK